MKHNIDVDDSERPRVSVNHNRITLSGRTDALLETLLSSLVRTSQRQ
jgi:hypothetical protein